MAATLEQVRAEAAEVCHRAIDGYFKVRKEGARVEAELDEFYKKPEVAISYYNDYLIEAGLTQKGKAIIDLNTPWRDAFKIMAQFHDALESYISTQNSSSQDTFNKISCAVDDYFVGKRKADRAAAKSVAKPK